LAPRGVAREGIDPACGVGIACAVANERIDSSSSVVDTRRVASECNKSDGRVVDTKKISATIRMEKNEAVLVEWLNIIKPSLKDK
jgi:hypothetical protein